MSRFAGKPALENTSARAFAVPVASPCRSGSALPDCQPHSTMESSQAAATSDRSAAQDQAKDSSERSAAQNEAASAEIRPAMIDEAKDDSGSSAIAGEENAKAEDADRVARLGRELFVFTNAKAGMQAVDATHVQQVVYEMSKDSAFFQNSLRQNERVEARIQDMQAKLAQLSLARRERLSVEIDRHIAKLESSRTLARTIVVVDMDMFYAAVEMRDNPALRDVPLAVGGLGMISTTNYAARKFGVRAAMPGFIGKELCPSLVFVPPNFDKYTKVAQQIRAVFAQYDPNFSAFSLDEACLDITDYMAANWQRYAPINSGDEINEDADSASHSEELEMEEWEDDSDGSEDTGDEGVDVEAATGNAEPASVEDQEKAEIDAFDRLTRNVRHRKRRRVSINAPVPPSCRLEVASAIVAEMRRKIFEVTELTASAGIACNTMLAKVCSDMNKPNGQYALPFSRQDVVNFVQNLPVRKIGGIGKVMEKTLAALGVTTGKELYDQRVAIFHVFSDKTATWLLRTSLGIQQPRREEAARKSFSRERTFRDMSDPDKLERKCREICDWLSRDLAKAHSGARNVTLKLKLVDFTIRSRSVSLATTISTSDQLFEAAVDLLHKELPVTLRLMGVRASNLVDLCAKSADLCAKSGDKSDQKKQLAIKQFTSGEVSMDMSPIVPPTSMTGARKVTTSVMDAFVETAPPSSMDEFQPCPICGRSLSVTNLIAVNTHIDACIEGRGQMSPPPKKKTKATPRLQKNRINTFFSSKPKQ